MSHEVFISFSFADKAQAETILNLLTNKHDIKCWICTRDIPGGVPYKTAIRDAIRSAKVLVFVQSNHSVESDQIPNEVTLALNYKKTVIPFIIEDSDLDGDLEYDLARVHRIDATEPPLEQRVEELARSIRQVIGSASVENRAASEINMQLNPRIPSGNPCFYGRKDILDAIGSAYAEGKRVIYLRGMGGIGKSEIAIQYAKKNQESYKTIVFARYGKSLASTLADDDLFNIDGFNRKITANGELQTDEEYAADKLKYLSTHCGKETLIILDNYDVETDPLFSAFAERGQYRVLITTRYDQRESRGYPVIPVGEIDDEELKEIFIANANPAYTSFDRDDPAFEELFTLTARHTLALEFIAQMAEELGCLTIGEVVDELKWQGLSAALKNVDGAYDMMARLVRNMTLSGEERTFLMCLQLMPPAGIERSFFKRWCPAEVFPCFNRLVRRSAVRFDPRTGVLSMHPILREIIENEFHPSYENCSAFIRKCTLVDEDYIPMMHAMYDDERNISINVFRKS